MAGPELVVLARHAESLQDPRRPRREWELTDEGREGATRLGRAWRHLDLAIVTSSTERKAAETARLAAAEVGCTFHTGHDLHEHEREFVADRAVFERALEELFRNERAWGPVEARFARALDAMVAAHHGQRIAVVTHGTVMSLHLAARYGLDGWATWQRLGTPSYAVLELRTRTIVDLVTSV